MRLCRTETIGPISFYAMLRRFAPTDEPRADAMEGGKFGLGLRPGDRGDSLAAFSSSSETR